MFDYYSILKQMFKSSDSYYKEIIKAALCTKRLGLDLPNFKLNPCLRYLTDDKVKELPEKIKASFGLLRPSDISAQCIKINFEALPVINNWLQCQALFTLGWIDDGSVNGYFKFDENFIRDRLLSPRIEERVSVHAWITLPSMEIIDLTFPTTLATLYKTPEHFFIAIAKHPSQLNGMVYKPIIIGTDVLIKTGILSGKLFSY